MGECLIVIYRDGEYSVVECKSRSVAERVKRALRGKSIVEEGPQTIRVKAHVRDVEKTLLRAGFHEEEIAAEGRWASLLEIFRVMFCRGADGGEVVVCPVCGSTRIKTIGVSGWLTPPLYRCEVCGYIGRVVLIISRDESGTCESAGRVCKERWRKGSSRED